MRRKFPVPPSRWVFAFTHCSFIDSLWRHYNISLAICGYLDSKSFSLFCCTSVILYTDHCELSFSLTEIKEGIAELNIDWEVPTPPIAELAVDV